MFRFIKAAFLLVFLTFIATGCWDIRAPQDAWYLTSIGFDYTANQYHVYVQVIDLSTVAKTEPGKAPQEAPVWVGEGIGDTATEAFNMLYDSSQSRLFYGQINALVYSENMIKKGLGEIFDLQNRYYELRYTPWVFGTKDSLVQLLTTVPLFNLSPTSSLLHEPIDNYKQRSTIKPISLRELITNFREPGKTVLLPSLKINKKNWNKDGTNHPLLEIDGVFALDDSSYKGWLPFTKVEGLRWMEPTTNRSPLVLRSDDELQAVVSLENPKVKVIPHVGNGEITYTLRVTLSGNISEMVQSQPESRLEQMAAEKVRTQIKDTFKQGLRMDADLFQLEHHLYRKKVRQWKKLRSQDEFALTPDSIRDIQVKVRLEHGGRLKVID